MDWEGLNGNSHIEGIRVVAFCRRSAAAESLDHVPLHQRRLRRDPFKSQW
jgi:hypothetical protein